MNAALIFWPVLAQIALTLAIYIFLARRKAGAVKSRAVNMREAALDNRAWPESVSRCPIIWPTSSNPRCCSTRCA